MPIGKVTIEELEADLRSHINGQKYPSKSTIEHTGFPLEVLPPHSSGICDYS